MFFNYFTALITLLINIFRSELLNTCCVTVTTQNTLHSTRRYSPHCVTLYYSCVYVHAVISCTREPVSHAPVPERVARVQARARARAHGFTRVLPLCYDPARGQTHTHCISLLTHTHTHSGREEAETSICPAR